MTTPQNVIRKLALRPLPFEGGYYRETYRSTEKIAKDSLPPRYRSEKSYCTAIFYMLTPATFSALHRLPTDEVFHFYLGDPVTMLQLNPSGNSSRITLGHEITKGHQLQTVVPRDTWQGSYLEKGGRFALMGTTMAPGFDTVDFEPGDRDSLVRRYPSQRRLIERLTPKPHP